MQRRGGAVLSQTVVWRAAALACGAVLLLVHPDGSVADSSAGSMESGADGHRPRSRQTINFGVADPGSENRTTAWWAAQFQAIQRVVGGNETTAIGPASHILFNLLGAPDDVLENQTRGLLEAAVLTRLPVFLGWDTQIFWGPPGLWNHFNSSAPGYDPANVANVEWTSWSPSDAVDVSWLNWGSQMRVHPAQNIHAPKVKAAAAHALTVVAQIVAKWYKAATRADRGLLAGIKIGCEAGIGWQVWQYKDTNKIFKAHPHNTSFDPTTGANHSAPPDPPTFGHTAQIGFAAATAAGLKASGPLTNADVQTLVHWYLANMTGVVVGAGVPKSVLLTHYGGTLIPKGADPVAPTMKYAGGELPGIGLGVSLYDTLLDLVPSFVAGPAQREEGWGAVEFGLPQYQAPAGTAPNSLEAWVLGMNRTLSLKGCRMLSQVSAANLNTTAAANILIAEAEERRRSL